MLVHVFDTLASADIHGIFARFLEKASGWEDCTHWRQGREYIIQGPPPPPPKKKKKGKKAEAKQPEQVAWPSGMICQKLGDVPSKVSLPVLWRLCRYYDTDDETCELVRKYLGEKGLEIERSPFFLVPSKGELHVVCGAPKQVPQVRSKKVRITVDKSELTAILLPHRGVVRVLLRRLEEASL